MSRRFALLVNPASAGGRALRALPEVIAELDRLGAPHRTVTTRSIEHAAEEARAAAQTGETVAALGGDGLLRPAARGALKGTEHRARADPLRARQRLRARARHPARPGRGGPRWRSTATERLIDVASVDGTPYLGIASFGFDSDANRIANEAKLVRGNAVYLYAALRALAAWKPARFTVTVDGARHAVTGYSVAVGNSQGLRRRHAAAPARRARRRQARRAASSKEAVEARPSCAGCRRSSRAPTSTRPTSEVARGEVIEVSSDRPFVIYADGDPIGATPATMRVEPRCLRVIGPG